MIRLVKNTIVFFLLIFLQIAVFDKIQFDGYIRPYYYIIFILLLPFNTPGWLLLLSSFGLGLSIDLFSQSLGMNAAACTFVAFVRPAILKTISPRDGYDLGTNPGIQYFGVNWFLRYVLILIFVHHFTLFYLEMFRFSDFFYTLVRVVFSSLFTGFLVVITEYFFLKR